MASTVGVEIREIEMDELNELWPLINTDDLVGALYIPKDGITSPVDTTMSLIKGARNGGAQVFEGVSVKSLTKKDGVCTGIETEDGLIIEAETVVMAGGMWTRQLAETIGVNVPLQACEHFYIVTEPLENVLNGMPTLRDPGNYTYFKEETGKIMAGFFEPRAKIWNLEGIPRDFLFGTLPEDWEHIGPIFEAACHRVPALADIGIQLFFNGPEAFTPDGTFYLGESPEVERCFIASGFNSVGIQSAGGVGWVLADWIIDGQAPMDLTSVDISRAFSFQSDLSYLEDRISESLGLLYAMHWPFRQYESARGIRTSALHDRLDEAGAVFGETAGWERPNWYANKGQDRVYEYSYGKQNWHTNMLTECKAVREAVGVFDQSSFAKFSVTGTDALEVLNSISANDIDVESGRGVYTQWLNDRGGIEADLTVNRLEENKFWVVTSAASQTKDFSWLTRASNKKSVTIEDITEDFSVIGVMGPYARDTLSPISSVDLSNENFAIIVFEEIMESGNNFGICLAGYHAMNSLRLESGYRHWGHDITAVDTPLEAGLSFAVAWDKPHAFVGKDSLVNQRDEIRTKKLLQFRIEDQEILSYHDDPIFRDGKIVGTTTGGMWSYTQDRCLTMGYAHNDDGVNKSWIDSGAWEIEVATRRLKVTPSIKSFYDPNKEKIRL